MRQNSNRSGWELDRRTVLQGAAASGIGLAGLSGLSGGAAADPSKPCEECGALLTKYEWDEEGNDGEGAFVWEKGRASLGIDGDEFNLTVVDTNEDGEPLCFEFDSIDNQDGVGIYEATCLTVKSGQVTETVEYGDWTSTDTYCVPDKYAISNFALCINDAMWQADFGTGDPPLLNTEDAATREGYGESSGRELIAAAVYGPPNRVGNYSFSQDVTGVNLVSSEFNLDTEIADATTATVEFEVTASQALELHFASWEMPGPYDKADIPWGPRYDVVHDMFDPGRHTITVNLPTL